MSLPAATSVEDGTRTARPPRRPTSRWARRAATRASRATPRGAAVHAHA
ncbi:hypothetical protein NKG05_17375 [Oerskovia sp. M15]